MEEYLLFKNYHEAKYSASIKRAFRSSGEDYMDVVISTVKNCLASAKRDAVALGMEEECKDVIENLEKRVGAAEVTADAEDLANGMFLGTESK